MIDAIFYAFPLLMCCTTPQFIRNPKQWRNKQSHWAIAGLRKSPLTSSKQKKRHTTVAFITVHRSRRAINCRERAFLSALCLRGAIKRIQKGETIGWILCEKWHNNDAKRVDNLNTKAPAFILLSEEPHNVSNKFSVAALAEESLSGRRWRMTPTLLCP